MNLEIVGQTKCFEVSLELELKPYRLLHDINSVLIHCHDFFCCPFFFPWMDGGWIQGAVITAQQLNNEGGISKI